jgi:S1-C subfamily serine protease
MNPINHATRRYVAIVVAGFAGAGALASIASARDTASVGTGVVTITTRLGYQGGAAAGTGMVLTSSGEILTNNHVIKGATTITIVLPGTGKSYTAKVVGYDVTDDVAVVQAGGATTLRALRSGGTATAVIGQLVHAVGNADGTGSLAKTTGQVTGLDRTITVNEESGGTSILHGLIETDAALRPGDSGGPLLNTGGKLVGMDTAAASTASQDVSTIDGYAIPIARALRIEQQIVAGRASTKVHIGLTAFLGVATASAGVSTIGNVVRGSPADRAGLAVGDVIASIGGTKVKTSAQIAAVMRSKKPGTRVAIAFRDANGTKHTTSAVLTTGPPQ